MSQNSESLKENPGPDLTTEDVARVVSVTARVVRFWVDQGRLPVDLYYKLPGDTHYRFKPEIIDWIRNRQQKAI